MLINKKGKALQVLSMEDVLTSEKKKSCALMCCETPQVFFYLLPMSMYR